MNQETGSKNTLGIAIVIAAVVIGGALLLRQRDPTMEVASDTTIDRVASLTYEFPNNHLHGLGYDSENNRIILATHYGLFRIEEEDSEWHLFQIGGNRDDFMGFSLHPENPDIMYTSGHPRTGGNMGVMRSNDGGFTFGRIFSDIRRGSLVDFHSMAISPANHRVLYGAFQGRLYRTRDGGDTTADGEWEFADAEGITLRGFCWGVPCLAADPNNEATVYAGTPEGLAVSRDFGEAWELLSDNDTGGVGGLGVDPHHDRIFAFTDHFGIAVSETENDALVGEWEARNDGADLTEGEIVFAFAFDRHTPDRIIAATTGNRVLITNDGGRQWERVL